MEKQVFWKSVFRRTGSLLLLLALIVAASFGFVLRAVEYLSVDGEIKRISENYRPVGTLTSESGDIAEAVTLLEESPCVDFVDKNRYCPAILKDIYNADLDGWSSCREDGSPRGVRTNDILAWAEVEDIKNTLKTGVFRYDFRVKELVSGYPDYGDPKKKITVYFDSAVLQDGNPVMEAGKIYLIKGYYVPLENSGSGNVLTFDLLPLEDQVWFLEGEPGRGAEQQYLDADTGLQERNRHAMMAVTTADMSAMPLVQESAKDFYLEAGRWLNREDSENGNMVCTVSKEFADARGLKVGDTLSATLQDRIPSYFGYVRDGDEDTWESCDKTEAELEIVGIYGRLYGGMVNNPNFVLFSHYSNIVYIPDGCLPESYLAGKEVSADSFSFVLTSPKVKDAFLRETGPALEALGISCTFVENNWDTYYRSARGIAQSARFHFFISAAVLVCSLAAVAFLYTWQRKKEIAVARSLGVPARAAAVASCLPMVFLGVPGILAGGIFAWQYGGKQAEKTLTEIAAGGRVELNALWLAGICLFLWLSLSAALWIGGMALVRRPALEILQDKSVHTARREKQKEEPAKAAFGNFQATEGNWSEGLSAESGCTGPTDGQKPAAIFWVMARFVWCHIRCLSVRPVCAIFLAAVFVTASGWLKLSVNNSEKILDRLYSSTAVEAEIVRKNAAVVVSNDGGAFIHRKTVEEVMDTGYVERVYLEAATECDTGKKNGSSAVKKTTVLGITEIDRFLANDWNKGVQIHYDEESGADLFQRDCTIEEGICRETPTVIVPEAVWVMWNLESDDLIYIGSRKTNVAVILKVEGYYTGELGGSMKDAMLAPLSFVEALDEDNTNYTRAEFTLDTAKNRELADFRDAAEAIVEAPAAGELELSLVVWDNELRQVAEPMEKNINLMKVLYPVANIVSFFIAAGLGVLLLFQRRREAAILRVLGVGVMPVRLTLSFELLVLNVAGVLLGLAAIYVVTEAVSLPAMGIAAAAYFAGGVIGAIVGSVVVTRARPLELLQVKE